MTKRERRTNEELELDRMTMAHYIIEISPSSAEFYAEYMKRYECCKDVARKEYKESMKFVARRLNDDLDVLRVNRLVRLQNMLNYLIKNESKLDAEKLVPMQLNIEKQMAELEGLKNFTTKTEVEVKQYNLND